MNISPVRISKYNRPFFNLNVEIEDNSIRKAVCYHARKKRLFEEAERKQNGVNISKASYYEDGTIKIDESSSVKCEDLGFKPKYELEITPLSKVINEISVGGFINVCCRVQLEEIQQLKISGGGMIEVRKGFLCDSTDYIRLVLWREYATLFEDGKTYTICNLKRSVWNNVDELHSSSTTSYKYAEDLKDYQKPDISDIIIITECSNVQ